MNDCINPPSLSKPVGFSHAVKATGTMVFLAGQIGCDASGKITTPGDMVGQFRQTLSNLKVAIEASGGQMTSITKLTIFVTDKQAYKNNLREIGKVYQDFFGKYYPAMTLAEISELYEDEAMIEIEGFAVI
jgi:enamine deaminase RidA (YjgF/YER057c/UK114 family)